VLGVSWSIQVASARPAIRLATPWSVPAFTAPAHQQKTAGFFNGALTNYLGHRYGLTGYWANTPLAMTGPGSVVEADAGPIVSNVFTTYLESAQ
jgi:hypothetical protein